MAYQSVFGSSSGSGYQSVFGSSGGLSRLVPPAAASKPEGSGVLGWFGNLLGDTKDLALGIASLGGQIVHDTGRGLAQVIPGHQSWGAINDTDPTGYHLDDIAMALPGAVVHDYATRYGGVSNIRHGLYEHPLSYILDALAVGGLATKGASLAAKGAVAGSEGASAAAKVATESAAIAGAKDAAAFGTRAGLDKLAEEGALTTGQQLARRILPSPEVRSLGTRVVTEYGSANPVRRLLLEAPARSLLTTPLRAAEPVLGSLDVLEHPLATAAGLFKLGDRATSSVELSRIEQRLGEIRGQLDAGAASEKRFELTQEFKRLNDLRGQALQGATRQYRPAAAAGKLWLDTNKVVGEVRSLGYTLRDFRQRSFMKALAPILGDPAERERAAGMFQRLNVDIPDLQPTDWGAELTDPSMARTIGPLAGAGGGSGTATRTRVLPQLTDVERQTAAAQVPEMLAATDDVTSRATEAIAKLRESHVANGEDPAVFDEYANRYLASLHDPIRQTLAVGAGAARTASDEAMENVRLALAQEAELPLLKSGAMTPKELLERTYRPLQMKYGAEFDAKTGEFVKGPSILQLDDALRQADLTPPVYFPYTRPEDVRFSDYLLAQRQNRLLDRAKRSATYTKRFEGKALQSGNFVNDPMVAYSLRAARQTRLEEAYRLVNAVANRYGRPISSIDEVMPGERVFNPAGLSRLYRVRRKLADVIDQASMEAPETRDAFLGSTIHDLLGQNLDELTAELEAGGKVYAIPGKVAQTLDDMNRWHLGSGVRTMWDAPMNMWRSAVLTGSPRWILNNFLGNTTFSLMQGARVRDALAILETRFKEFLNSKYSTNLDTSLLEKLGKVPGVEEVGQGFASHDARYAEHLGQASDSVLGKAITSMRGTKVAQAGHRWADFVTRVNGEVETAFRQASYVKALDSQIDRPAIMQVAKRFWTSKQMFDDIASRGIRSGGELNRALDTVNYFFGDYTRMTPFERNIVRRFVFPFWGFYRHQARLIASFPFDYPGRAEVLSAISHVTDEMQQQYGPVPDWLRGAVPLGPPGDTVPFLSTRGPDPFSASFEPPTSMLSPPLKIFLQQALGRDLFTGQKYTSEDVVTPYGSDQSFRIVRDANGTPIAAEPTEHVAPSILESFLQQIPQYQAAKGSFAGGSTYDTATLLDVLTGHGVIRDETGAPKYPTNVGQQLSKLGGVATIDYGLGSYQQRLADEQHAALLEAMRRMGIQT